MSDSQAFVRPAPMEGHGVYNRSSRVQAAGLSPAVPLLGHAARTVALSAAPQPIVIADYGSSEGHNSLDPLVVAISALRERVGPERAISIVHTDLPDNDFSALFRMLTTDPNSYLRGDPAIFTSAVGRSFYEQILPASSVTLAWSSWAIQWLSRVPAAIPDQVQVAYSRDAAVRAAFARQAAEDWGTFLVHRGCELRLGGRLVVGTSALVGTASQRHPPACAGCFPHSFQPSLGRFRHLLGVNGADGDFPGSRTCGCRLSVVWTAFRFRRSLFDLGKALLGFDTEG